MKRKVPRFITQSLARIASIYSVEPMHSLEKIDDSLTPNMRALRLTMTIAEQLLSMGVVAHDVVRLSLGITETYCRRPVHMDVCYTLITISQDRGVDREPLTMIRVMVPDYANYQQIQALQSLALEIRNKHLPLHIAEQRVEKILSQPKRHSPLVICASGGLISAGVIVMYDGDLLMIGLSFIMGFVATIVLRWLWRVGMTTFYSQASAALFATLAAAGIAWANMYGLRMDINATLLVISGIVLLVAGLMTVGAFQDAIDEFYITANARLLKVIMATGGIVVGVVIGLYVATKFGITFPATPDRLSLADKHLQYLGALIVAAAFAVGNHARWSGLIVSGLIGVFGWWISRLLLIAGFDVVVSSGIAATVIGLMAVLTSRLWRFPSMAIIAAGIVPLVPGLSLYNGLMGVVLHPPSDPLFMTALAILMRAVMIGLAVAAGASLGNMTGRPIRRWLIRTFRQEAPEEIKQ